MARMRRSKHTLSNYKLTTFDMGELVPVGLYEVLPGDTLQMSTSALVRLSPLAAPVYHPTKVRIHHFFVPNRIAAEFGTDGSFNWEDFITGGPDGTDSQTPPQIALGGTVGTLGNYLGIPSSAEVGINVNALPVFGYNMIYNDYYRDQDLIPEVAADSQTVQKCAWEKDYFAGARPWTQKGPDVTLPVGTKAPVYGIGSDTQVYAGNNIAVYETGKSTTTAYSDHKATSTDNDVFIQEDPDNPGFPGIYADLSAATAINVNDFRKAFALQRYQEARARYGSRFTEYLRYLGITPSDARLQRPEYLGGGTTMINFSEVLQTTPDSTGSKENYGVGDLYGHGIAAMRTGKVRRFIEEHGYVFTLMSVRPKAIYQNAIDRHWLKQHKEDYYQRELEAIGQQPIWGSEVFPDLLADVGAGGAQNRIWGYQDRYMEYRQVPSKVTGEMETELDFWHMARQFAEEPALNKQFVDCNPSKRIYNVQTNDGLWVLVNNHVVARRLVKRNAKSRIL